MKEKISGIYRIVNTVTQTVYIGSSVDIHNRWKQHLYVLRKNAHHSKYLQNAWNKYGQDSFLMEIVEKVEPDKSSLLEKEQYYIDVLKPGYNGCPKAGSRLGSKQSDETRQKISQGNTGKVVSDETKEKIRRTNTGKKRSDETKQKISDILRNRSDAIRIKISEANKTRVVSETTKEKLRQYRLNSGRTTPNSKGVTRSDEFKQRVSGSLKGHSVSDETRRKLSEANKGRPSPNRKHLSDSHISFILCLRRFGTSLKEIAHQFNEKFQPLIISTRVVQRVINESK